MDGDDRRVGWRWVPPPHRNQDASKVKQINKEKIYLNDRSNAAWQLLFRCNRYMTIPCHGATDIKNFFRDLLMNAILDNLTSVPKCIDSSGL